MPEEQAPVLLVVDDYPTVLATTSLRLKRAGFVTLDASSGVGSLQILEPRGDVAAVLCDCTMPEMSGPELCVIIQAHWPHIRCIAHPGKPKECDLPPRVPFLQKPYRTETLIKAVQSALAAATDDVPAVASMKLPHCHGRWLR